MTTTEYNGSLIHTHMKAEYSRHRTRCFCSVLEFGGLVFLFFVFEGEIRSDLKEMQISANKMSFSWF